MSPFSVSVPFFGIRHKMCPQATIDVRIDFSVWPRVSGDWIGKARVVDPIGSIRIGPNHRTEKRGQDGEKGTYIFCTGRRKGDIGRRKGDIHLLHAI